MQLQNTMNVVARWKIYLTRLLAHFPGTQHGELSKSILCVTLTVYIVCQIVVSLNRDHCSSKTLSELSRANDRLQRVESTLETLEEAVVRLMRDREGTRPIPKRVVRSSHGKRRKRGTRAFRSEIRYLKRKMKSLERRVQCAYSVNNTDLKGRPCGKYPIGEKFLKKILNGKKPKPEASGTNDQKDSNDKKSSSNGSSNIQSEQRRKQSTIKRKMSRRSGVYTRWGTTQCRTSNKSHTSLVYSGRVASAHYRNKGGGSNYLCLPDRAFYTNPGNITEDQSAHLYPVKYGKVMNIFNKYSEAILRTLTPEERKKMTASLDFKDVPCAVCRVDGATAVLMVPAHNICPRRWDRQYHGYLMSQKHDYEKSEFICVDVEAQGIPNTQNPKGNAFLHLTEFKCGSSSCSSYKRHKALSCTVCTT